MLYLFHGFITVYIGGLLELPEWLNSLSVFEHIPRLLASDVEPESIIWMIGIAIVLIAAGFIGYQRRDLAG
ncbi:hypothetical protein [Lentibacillus sp. CBA3610]|uniref:hypothetical protein n=1 Tax=Lentibacillus sp. CBA3610 TaxID=2518176 RepID=UPI0015963852|nr:hypothetical protein [Lentibacillus sp. CBA3610]